MIGLKILKRYGLYRPLDYDRKRFERLAKECNDIEKMFFSAAYVELSRWGILTPQRRVAGYRLDFALEAKGLRVAIEIDGRQYHTLENDLIADYQRKRNLQRRGWLIFIRFRGGEVYRDPQKCVSEVVEILRGLR